MTLRYERRHRRLEVGRHALHRGACHPPEDLGKIGRRYHVADAQRREHDLGETADIDYAAGLIDTLKRRRGITGIVQFAVEIVLDDPGSAAFGGIQQFKTTRERHGHGKRMLGGGGDECEAEGFRQRKPSGYVNAFVIDRHRHECRSVRDQAVARADVTRVLKPHLVAMIEQHLADAVERILCAVEDEDLVRRAGDAAIGPEVAGNRLAQFRQACGIGIAQHQARRASPVLCRQPGPEGHRELVIGRHPRHEGARHIGMIDAGKELLGSIEAQSRQTRRLAALHRARCGDGRLWTIALDGIRDKGASPHPRLYEPLGSQLLIDIDGGGAGHVLLAGEGAARRQALAGGQLAGEYERAQRASELNTDCGIVVPIDPDRRYQRSRCIFDHAARSPLQHGMACKLFQSGP